MKNAPETRALGLEMAEIRVEKRDNGRRAIVGYAAVFDSWSEDLGGFQERIRPGAFGRALAEGADVRFLVNHDPSLIFGRTRSGTLRLVEDTRGLRSEVQMPDTDLSAHYLAAVERGDLDGMSFRFYVQKELWDFDSPTPRRDLIEVDIDDVSLATFPAYADTAAAVRSLESNRRSQPRRTPARDRAERMLRLAEAY